MSLPASGSCGFACLQLVRWTRLVATLRIAVLGTRKWRSPDGEEAQLRPLPSLYFWAHSVFHEPLLN